MNLLHHLLDSPARRSGAVALGHRGVKLGYGKLVDRTLRIAAGLHRLGVARGDRVVAYLANRPEMVEIAIACSRLGAVFVPANPLLKQRQITHIMVDSGARVLVTSSHAAVPHTQFLAECPAVTAVVLCDTAAVLPMASVELLPYEQLLDNHWDAGDRAVDQDPAAIFYTSGSTGRPKGVVVSHRNLVSGAQCVAAYLDNQADDRILAALPLSFDYGFSQVSTALLSGACALLTNFSTPAALVREVAVERVTGLAGVPTMWAQLAAVEWDGDDWASLRYLTNSGGAMPLAVLQTLRARLPNARFYCMYGLTEAFRSTYLPPEELDRRPGSIGRAVANQEIFVLRPDGTRCAAGEVGELVHRGSFVSLGYWNDPQLTNERFRALPAELTPGVRAEIAAWSGDLVRQDADGFLYFVGRADNQLKTSGYRVSVTEIEQVVAELPEVSLATVVGLEDAVMGQRLALAVVVRDPQDGQLVQRVRQHCRMCLPPYMVPDEIRAVSSLPLNPNGKPDRVAIQSLFAA